MRSLLTVSEEWGETGRNRLVVIAVSATVGASVRTSAGISATMRSAARRSPAIAAAAWGARRWTTGIRSTIRNSAAIAAISASAWGSTRTPFITASGGAAAGIVVSAARSYDWLLHIQRRPARAVTVESAPRIVLARARLLGGLGVAWAIL